MSKKICILLLTFYIRISIPMGIVFPRDLNSHGNKTSPKKYLIPMGIDSQGTFIPMGIINLQEKINSHGNCIPKGPLFPWELSTSKRCFLPMGVKVPWECNSLGKTIPLGINILLAVFYSHGNKGPLGINSHGN